MPIRVKIGHISAYKLRFPNFDKGAPQLRFFWVDGGQIRGQIGDQLLKQIWQNGETIDSNKIEFPC